MRTMAIVFGLLVFLGGTVDVPAAQYRIDGDRGYLVGGEGRTGDSFRYDGSEIWTGPGQAVIAVDDQRNQGLVMGTVTTHGHTYTIVLDRFSGDKPFMDGGIASNVRIHGTTGNGPPVLPEVLAYLAGWGRADVYKDGKLLYQDYDAHFMLTQGTRDKTTHRVAFSGPGKLMQAKQRGDRKAVAAAKREIAAAAVQAIDPGTMQLHVVAHSERKKAGNFPPFETFIHFMWDEITWY